MPTIDPFNPYAGQQTQVNRQQRLADAMRMQSLTPIQNVGAHPGSSLSITQVLAKLMEAYAGNRMEARSQEQQQQLAQQMMQARQQGVDSLMSGMQSNPNEAIMQGLAHSDPAVVRMAQHLAKGQLTPKDLAKYSTNESVLSAASGNGQFQPKANLTSVVPGNLVMDADAGKIINPQIDPGAGQTLETINGDLYGTSPTGRKQLNKAPRINNTVNVSGAAQQHGLKSIFGKAADRVDEVGRIANASSKTLQSLNELESKANSGVFENVTSGPASWFSNLAQALNVPLSQEQRTKLGNTESFNAETINLWNSIINSQEGGHKGVVKEEAELIMKSLPLAKHSPEARQLITDTLRRAAERTQKEASQALDSYFKAVQTDDVSQLAPLFKEVYLPEAATTIPNLGEGKSKRISVEDFLKE